MQHIGFIILCALLPVVAGCMAFDVGKPKTISHANLITTTSSVPRHSEVMAVNPSIEQQGNLLAVRFNAKVHEEYEKMEHEETVSVRVQKRLAVGLFPGAADQVWTSRGALVPIAPMVKRVGYGGYDSYPIGLGPFVVGSFPFYILYGIPSTIESVLFEPFFGKWSCGLDFVDPDSLSKVGPRWDASMSNKMQALQRLNEDEWRILDIDTCFRHDKSDGKRVFGHFGLVGIHKFQAIYVDPAVVGSTRKVGIDQRRREISLPGPFSVSVSIPEANWSIVKTVEPGQSELSIPLPPSDYDSSAEAVVIFDGDEVFGSIQEITHQGLSMARGRSWRTIVTLQGRYAHQSKARNQSNAGKPTPSDLYAISGIQLLEDGRYKVRVSIYDKSKTFAIGRTVETDVRIKIREDFRDRNPGVPEDEVREIVQWQTENDGATLIYTGWAFSIRPDVDRWTYDSTTRTGQVRLRVSGGIPTEDIKRWGRDNISSIVADKNIVLERGLPSGAQYRSLDESFENGVLSINFEAVN